MNKQTQQPRIVITHRVHNQVIELLEPYGELIVNQTDRTWPTEVLYKHAKTCDAMMIFMPDRVDEKLLDACLNLQLIAGALKGYDNVEIELCDSRGICVTNVPDLLTEPTAELAVALLLGLIRHVGPGDRYIRGGTFTGWRPTLYGGTLVGAIVGILGMGAVGQAIARRLQTFRCSLIYNDVNTLNEDRQVGRIADYVELPELIKQANVLVLATPLNDASMHLLDKQNLCKMTRGSYLVNVGRGSVVDEWAVVALLADGHLAGYAADVYEMEDLSRSDRPTTITQGLLDLSDRTLLTPHLGSAVDAIRLEVEMTAARNIIDKLEGRPPCNAINQTRSAIL